MKFTKHQKETIRRIYTGDIYDISSYLKYFNLRSLIKFDKEKILNRFNSDEMPKKYYCANSLKLKYSNIMPECEYISKLQLGEINPENYSAYELNLSYNSGIKHEVWEGSEYCIDFYDGVYIANCFDNILEFLVLWQFLLSEMLILEVPHSISAETLGLLYDEKTNPSFETLSTNERIKRINFQNFSYDDQYYLHNIYTLSQEHCLICKEYMNKRIYPSTKLGIFIAKRFSTYEENTQNKALFVAWLAIFVSIALTFAPFFQQKDNTNIESITEHLKDIESSIEEKELSEELSTKMDIIIDRLDMLLDKISSKSINRKPNETSTEQ